MEIDDLPDVEAGSDHPSAQGLRTTKTDPGKQPCLRRLLRELFDHRATGPTTATALLVDELLGRFAEPDRHRLSLGHHYRYYIVVDGRSRSRGAAIAQPSPVRQTP